MAAVTARPGVFLYRDYVDLLKGDIIVALMLSQLVYWYLPSRKTGKSKLRVLRNGLWWVVKSHVHWADECGITRRQVNRCLTVLKAAGLIDTAVYKFDGKPMVHVRLLIARGKNGGFPAPTAHDFHMFAAKYLASLQAKNAPSGAVSYPSGGTLSAPDGAVACTLPCNDLQILQQENTTGEYKQELCFSNTEKNIREKSGLVRTTVPTLKREAFFMDEVDPLCSKRDSGEGRGYATLPERKEEDLMNTKEILAAHAARSHDTSSMGAYWLSMCASETGKMQYPLTGKQQGQLKHLKTLLGEGDAKRVIRYVVPHWWKFGQRAQASAGLASFPVDPHIGFMVAHYAVALDLLQPVAPASVPSTPPVLTPSVSAILPVTETPSPLLSSAELEVLLESLKE